MKFLNGLGLIIAVGLGFLTYSFEAELDGNALMILGVMFSISFGFYISALTILLGSSTSRFLKHVISKQSLSDSELDVFTRAFSWSALLNFVAVSLIFLYLVFQKSMLDIVKEVFNASIVGLSAYCLICLMDMFFCLVHLMKNEASVAPRSTLTDADEINEKRYPDLKNNKSEFSDCYKSES